MDNPGYGPLCCELKRAYKLLTELTRDAESKDDALREGATKRLEAVRERIKRCESRLLVVSLGQEAPCDLKQQCSEKSPQA